MISWGKQTEVQTVMRNAAQHKSRLMIIASMAIFGTLGLFVRNIPIPSAALALCRAVMAVALLELYFMISGQRIDFRAIRKELPLLLISGMAIGVNWILLFEAYRYTTVSVATLSYYFAPVLVTIACPLLFHEKMGAKQWICFAMSTLGIVLITGIGDLSGNNRHLTGILLGLSAAVLYATAVILNKVIKGVAGIQRTFLQFSASIAILLPYVLCTGGVQLGLLDGSGWISLLVVGMLHTGLAYCLYFSAIKDISGQEAAILSYIDPLVAVAVSFFVLSEQMIPTQILGGALVLGFTLWNEMTQKK